MNIILYYYILFYIILIYKINFILQDSKIHKYKKNQYYKKNKKKIIRGNIYDKNLLLLNYTQKKRINKKGEKKTIEKREYLYSSCMAINGIVNYNFQGLSGLELFYNNILNKIIDQKFFSRKIGNEKFEAQFFNNPNNNLITTIDAIQSEKTYHIIKENVNKFLSEYGICIIMDGYTGEIETITQYPQYNEDNKKNIDIKFLYPLSITQSHEIGSTIKAFLMLSALNENIVNPDTQINCWGVKEKKIQGKILTTWKAHGIIPFKTVIKESNNFGVAQIGMILNEKLFSYYNNFGFGIKTGIPIFGEHQGILNPITKWSKRTPISLSFGYEISCTLLQLVSAWSLFTNNGKRVYPKIIENEKSKYSDQIVNQKAIDDSLSILCINKEYKKQYGFEKLNDVNIYGKTGTANTLLNNQYNKNINIYTFIGHIEKNNIKKIIGISIHGSNNSSLVASQIALPIFFEISSLINEKINKLYKKNN